MKALSIIQPWASLIVYGVKDIENRTWTTTYRGPLLVHAGKKMLDEQWAAAADMMGRAGLRRTVDLDPLGWLGTQEPRGGIVGVADLVDVVRDSPSPWAIPGSFHWLLRNPRRLSFRPWTGALGLFNVEDDSIATDEARRSA